MKLRSSLVAITILWFTSGSLSAQTLAEVDLQDGSTIKVQTELEELQFTLAIGGQLAIKLINIDKVETEDGKFFITLNNSDRFTATNLGRDTMPFSSAVGQFNVDVKTFKAIRFMGPASPQLVLHYDFDPILGDKVLDLSGNDFHGTVRGDATLVAGKSGQGLRIKSAKDYVEAKYAGLDSTHWKGMTTSVWLYIEGTTTYGTVLSKMPVGSRGGAWSLNIGGYYGSKKRNGVFGHSRGEVVPKTFGRDRAFPPLEKWYHLVATTDGKTVRFYVNGKLDGERVLDVRMPFKDDPEFTFTVGKYRGHREDWLDSYQKGIYDEVKIFRGVLSESDVQALYAQHADSDQDPAVAPQDVPSEEESTDGLGQDRIPDAPR